MSEKWIKNEHYVPHFLIDFFKGEKGIYYLNKERLNIGKCSTKNACTKEDTYEVKRNLGNDKFYFLRNDIEIALSARESDYSHLCRKIIAICDNPNNLSVPILHTDEKELLAEFVLNLHFRHPKRLLNYKSVLRDKLGDDEGFLKNVECFTKGCPDDIVAEIFSGASEYGLMCGIVLPLENEKGFLNYYKSSLLSNGSFCILKSTNDNFIISDNAASVSKDGFIFIPISPRYVIAVSLDNYYRKNKHHNRVRFVKADAELKMILRMYQESDKYIYGRKATLEKIKNIVLKNEINELSK